MKMPICLLATLILFSLSAPAQTPEVKFIADTLVVQADGTYEADPDLATVTFQIFSQGKEIKRAYDAATQSIQHIVDLAERNGLQKDDISTGVLTVAPIYEGDRKKRAHSYYVQGQIVLRIRDFTHIAPFSMALWRMASPTFARSLIPWPTKKQLRNKQSPKPCAAPSAAPASHWNRKGRSWVLCDI
jgi:Protein of unknown function (DUF541)